MKEDSENTDKKVTFQRPMNKKNTSIMQHKKLSLEHKIKRSYNRSHSTKLPNNFVPQLKPKKSFCKPTFFQLDENNTNNQQNEKIKEIEEVYSSSDDDDGEMEEVKVNCPISSSSDFESDEGQNENGPSNESNENEKNNNMKLDAKLYKEDTDCIIEKNNDNSNCNIDKTKLELNLKNDKLTKNKYYTNSIFDILANKNIKSCN